MQDSNPYSSPSAELDASLPVEAVDESYRPFVAFLIGLVCSLIGPIFLASYYSYHGIGIGLANSFQFFGLVYIAPSLLLAAVGLPIGFGLSLIFPRLEPQLRRSLVIGLATVLFSFSAVLLLAGALDFAVNLAGLELPAFATACGGATFLTTATYLAFS